MCPSLSSACLASLGIILSRLIICICYCNLVLSTYILVISSIWPRRGSHFGGSRVAVYGYNFAEDLFSETNEITFGGSPCNLIEFACTKYKIQCVTGPSGKYRYDHIIEEITTCRLPPFRHYDELQGLDIYYPETEITNNAKTYSTTVSYKTFSTLDSYTPKVNNVSF